jgi:hypothetical protein
MELGGGPNYTQVGLVTEVGSLLLGGPMKGNGAVVTALIAAAALLVSIGIAIRDKRPDWPFLVAVVLLPVAYSLIAQPHFMFVRYFLLALVFALLLICRAIARCWNSGNQGRTLAVICCLCFVVGNLVHTRQLIVSGRGNYSQALAAMASSRQETSLLIGGDHDHGLRKIVEYYSARLNLGGQVAYCDSDSWPREGVDWIIFHEAKDASGPARRLAERIVVDRNEYSHEGIFEATILSGWRWHCYRRSDASTGSS